MPNYYDDWNKQWQEVSENLKSISSQLRGLDFNESFINMRDIYVRLNSLCCDKHFKIYDEFHTMDFSQLLGVSEQLKTLSSVDVLGVSTALKQFANNNNLQEIKNLSINISEMYDYKKLAKIMQDSFAQIDWTQVASMEDITEEIAEQYIEDELKDENNQRLITGQVKQVDKEKIKNEIAFWVTIISFILSIYSIVISKPSVTNNTYNNTVEVNYNYTVELGLDAEFMNQMGYRIINQNNVMPRKKPNCSSMVTGHLYIGQVVCVSNKYKKWIEITWKNNDGEFCSGWIQNYRVTEFK